VSPDTATLVLSHSRQLRKVTPLAVFQYASSLQLRSSEKVREGPLQVPAHREVLVTSRHCVCRHQHARTRRIASISMLGTRTHKQAHRKTRRILG
jgi:hypothetical protein